MQNCIHSNYQFVIVMKNVHMLILKTITKPTISLRYRMVFFVINM